MGSFMKRNVFVGLVLVTIALIAVVIFLNRQESTQEIPGDLPVVEGQAGGSVNAVRTFDLQVAGDVSFVMPPGMAAWHRIEMDNADTYYQLTFIGADGAPDWILQMYLPAVLDVTTYTLADSRPTDRPFAHILPPSTMVESTHYNAGASGTITITAANEETGISGSFDLTLSSADGQSVTATGTFTEIPLLD